LGALFPLPDGDSAFSGLGGTAFGASGCDAPVGGTSPAGFDALASAAVAGSAFSGGGAVTMTSAAAGLAGVSGGARGAVIFVASMAFGPDADGFSPGLPEADAGSAGRALRSITGGFTGPDLRSAIHLFLIRRPHGSGRRMQ
jgi:hypothetical protein